MQLALNMPHSNVCQHACSSNLTSVHLRVIIVILNRTSIWDEAPIACPCLTVIDTFFPTRPFSKSTKDNAKAAIPVAASSLYPELFGNCLTSNKCWLASAIEYGYQPVLPIHSQRPFTFPKRSFILCRICALFRIAIFIRLVLQFCIAKPGIRSSFVMPKVETISL